jgi:hypothetical protein
MQACIVAGTSSAFGLFGIAKVGPAIVATPTLFTAFAFVLASFVALLYMLRAKTFGTPDLGVYLTPATAREDNRLGLALSLAARYNEMRAELRREIAAEPHVLFVAYASIATAAILIVLNTVAPPGEESKRSGTRAVSPNATPPFSPVSARVGNRRRPSPVPGLRLGTP